MDKFSAMYLVDDFGIVVAGPRTNIFGKLLTSVSVWLFTSTNWTNPASQ